MHRVEVYFKSQLFDARDLGLSKDIQDLDDSLVYYGTLGLLPTESARRGQQQAGYPHNLNGSIDNIVGICDSTGCIFGLMPHPEDRIRGTQHPQWTRLGAKEYGDGFRIFQNAVEWIKQL